MSKIDESVNGFLLICETIIRTYRVWRRIEGYLILLAFIAFITAVLFIIHGDQRLLYILMVLILGAGILSYQLYRVSKTLVKLFGSASRVFTSLYITYGNKVFDYISTSKKVKCDTLGQYIICRIKDVGAFKIDKEKLDQAIRPQNTNISG